MVETDVASDAPVDVFLHILLRCFAPGVWWVVQLQYQVILLYLTLWNLLGRVQHREFHVQPFLLVFKPLQTGSRESFMKASAFCQYQYPTGRNGGLAVLHEAEVERAALVALRVVAGIVPVHATPQLVVQDVLALGSQGTGVLVAPDKLALVVHEIGHHALFVPTLFVALRKEPGTVKLPQAFITALAFSVEGHSHHQFLTRHAGFQMLLNGF